MLRIMIGCRRPRTSSAECEPWPGGEEGGEGESELQDCAKRVNIRWDKVLSRVFGLSMPEGCLSDQKEWQC